MSIDLVQGSDEWKQARCGSLGASRLHEAIARTKTGFGASRATLMAELICERLTAIPAEKFVTSAMQNGMDTEAEARHAYVFYTGSGVIEVGLVPHPTIAGTHASPDGLVGAEGLLEIKCPQPAAHLDTLLGSVPGKYLTQMAWQMACTGRQWCDFVSYNASFPENMRLFIQRVHRDDARVAELEREVAGFLLEITVKLAALTDRYGLQDAA